MAYFDWDYLGLGCQYPVKNVGALAIGPEPEIDCGEPAVAIARWHGPGEEPYTMLLCMRHLNHVIACEKERGDEAEKH